MYGSGQPYLFPYQDPATSRSNTCLLTKTQLPRIKNHFSYQDPATSHSNICLLIKIQLPLVQTPLLTKTQLPLVQTPLSLSRPSYLSFKHLFPYQDPATSF